MPPIAKPKLLSSEPTTETFPLVCVNPSTPIPENTHDAGSKVESNGINTTMDKNDGNDTHYFRSSESIQSHNVADHANSASRRNSANFTRRRRSSASRISAEILQHITLTPNIDSEKILIALSEIPENILAQIPPEDVDLTVPTKLWPQIVAAISVSLASMVIGICAAYTSPAAISMAEDSGFQLGLDEISWMGSLMPLGALVGGIIGGTLVEFIGRKRTIVAAAPGFIISWILVAIANNISAIYTGRALAGVCVGITCLCLPLYLAETVQPEVRGTLGLLPTTVGNLGILIAYIGGTYLNWRNLAYLGGALCVPYMTCMLLVPETPRWYIAHGREAEGAKSLQWLRGTGADISRELTQIKNANALSKKQDTKFKDLLSKAHIKPLLVALGLMLFQQFSGINAVFFYTKTIVKATGSEIDDNLCSIIIGIVNIASTIFATLLIDRVGRKVLLLISDLGMILALAALGIFFYYKESQEDSVQGLGWISLLSFMLFVVSFSLGFGPIPWLMLGEIFPARIRGSGAAAAATFNWGCTFLVTKSFPAVVGEFGAATAFFGFGIICIIGIFFIVFEVPETSGTSLEDIETNLTRPFRRASSTANLKPFPFSV